MDTIKDGVVSLSLIANLNWDRFLFLGLIGAALFAAGYMVSL
jgi:hypothetical protein